MITITKKDFLDAKFDDFIKKELENGNVIIFPSESCYGLAANATNQKAIRKIHQIKNEDKKKSIGIITDNLDKIKKFVKIDKNGKKLLTNTKKPITVLFQTKIKMPVSNNNFLGVRIPINKEALKLCSLVNFPLTATSANLHSKPSIYCSKEIKKIFNETKFIFIDAKKLKITPPSTYYNYKTCEIIRAGEISIKQIRNIMK